MKYISHTELTQLVQSIEYELKEQHAPARTFIEFWGILIKDNATYLSIGYDVNGEKCDYLRNLTTPYQKLSEKYL